MKISDGRAGPTEILTLMAHAKSFGHNAQAAFDLYQSWVVEPNRQERWQFCEVALRYRHTFAMETKGYSSEVTSPLANIREILKNVIAMLFDIVILLQIACCASNGSARN